VGLRRQREQLGVGAAGSDQLVVAAVGSSRTVSGGAGRIMPRAKPTRCCRPPDQMSRLILPRRSPKASAPARLSRTILD
jgi:hypothetical protein